MKYNMQEGYLTLSSGEWQDRSVNVLAPRHLKTKGANLVVARDTMPMGTDVQDYLEQEKQTFRKELAEFQILADVEDSIGGHPVHFLEFTWKGDGKDVYQIMGIIPVKENIISLTATIPGAPDKSDREELLEAIISFRFHDPPQEPVT